VIYAPERLDDGIAALSAEPVFRAILDRAGAPRFRRRANGFPTLLHIILEQQVSIDAAAAMHRRLVGLCRPLEPVPFLALDDDTLKRCGFSRQKTGYARGLAEAVTSGRLDFAALAATPDDEARNALVALKGIGRWSAEIYLLTSLHRTDVMPADDLALLIGYQRLTGAAERPRASALRLRAEAWRPWRSVAARLLWHYYARGPKPLSAVAAAGGIG